MTSPQDEAECLETVNIPRESYSCQKMVVIVPFPSKIQAILLNMDSCESDIESFGDSELSESYFCLESRLCQHEAWGKHKPRNCLELASEQLAFGLGGY